MQYDLAGRNIPPNLKSTYLHHSSSNSQTTVAWLEYTGASCFTDALEPGPTLTLHNQQKEEEKEKPKKNIHAW